MVDQPDLLHELPYVERVQLTERLKNAKKQRALQLKGYEQREKRFAKEQALASKKTAKKNKKGSNGEDNADKANEQRFRLRFSDSVLMMDAVARNDVEEVKRLLASGISPDIRGQDGLTALHQSCIDNSPEMVRLLVESNADINARDMELWTPLHAVATCGHLDLCRYLCEHGGDLLAMNSDGNMPYDLCEDITTLDFIETEMTRQGVTQELIDETRLGIENVMLADLKKLSADNGDLDYRGPNGETLLHIAACCGFTHATKFLLEQKVEKDVVDNDSWQPVHCAAFWGQPAVVEILLTHGVDPDASTRDGETIIDLCEDPEAKQRIIELVDAVKHKQKLMKYLTDGDRSTSRRMSSARRSSIASPASLACQRRSSLHDRRDSVSLRELREEAQRFHESLLSCKVEDEEEGEHADIPITDATKVLIVISTPSENESNVEGPVEDSEMPCAIGEESQCVISNNKASYTVQASDNENCTQVVAVENGTGTGSRQPSSKLQSGDGDQSEKHTEELSKCDTGDNFKVKIPNSPSASMSAQKKPCGSGCCTVS